MQVIWYDLGFKCPDENHGVNFENHEEAYLNELLSKLRPFKELNILIMGETGVGKSTWINAFLNFIRHETLEKAEAQEELLSLIPSKFTVFDEKLKKMVIKTGGVDKNEVMVDGQSATQGARIYTFYQDNTIIRLIDTPGVGDVRGSGQDAINFKNILDTIENIKELHGICILLKPNDSRVTVMFRFCIQELLTHLHRDACNNILFCFTNSRGTFYRPGETLPVLQAHLEELLEKTKVEIALSDHTIYCFDSESYRYLAAIKNDPPATFLQKERANFAASWEHSFKETGRMMKHIRSLEPHSVKSMLNLNNARSMVLKLTRPLAEISRNIQTNKAIVKDEKERIQATEEDIKKLKQNLYTTRTEIEVTKIDYPRTVCSNSACTKTWNITGQEDKKTTEYVQVCHAHCYLNGIAQDSIGDPGLINCAAMSNGVCIHSSCGHRYQEHLHIYYLSKQVGKQVEDQSVREALEKKLPAKQMKQQMIAGKDQEIAEYESELKTIQEASVRFAYFLKTNAITPYNDAMEEYLKHLIREENNKVFRGGSDATLMSLEDSLASYFEERAILDEAMAKGEEDSKITPDEIADIVSRLKALKHSGQSLKDALDCVKRTAYQVHKSISVQPKPIKPKVTSGGAISGKKGKAGGYSGSDIGIKGFPKNNGEAGGTTGVSNEKKSAMSRFKSWILG